MYRVMYVYIRLFITVVFYFNVLFTEMDKTIYLFVIKLSSLLLPRVSSEIPPICTICFCTVCVVLQPFWRGDICPSLKSDIKSLRSTR